MTVAVLRCFVRMLMAMFMSMLCMMMCLSFDVPVGAPCHPKRKPEDDQGRPHLKVRLRTLGVPLAAIMEGQRGQQPDDQAM